MCVCVCVFARLGLVRSSSESQFLSLFIVLQILTLYDSLSVIDIEAVVRYVAGLQQPDGSFIGNKWGKGDNSSLSLSLSLSPSP